MKRLRQLASSFFADESGVTAMEYALIGALIAVAIAAAVSTLGLSVKDMFTKVASCFPSGGC